MGEGKRGNVLNLDDLRIGQREIDALTGLDVTEIAMGWAYRLSLFRVPKRVLSWLATQLLTLGVALVLWVPITLVVARNIGGLEQTGGMLGAGCLGVGFAIATTLLWNACLLYRGKQLTTLTHLLDEVDHFNEILNAVEIFNELCSVNPQVLNDQGLNPENQAAILEALHLTRENLVNGLMTERIMRKHQRFIARRHDLFARIEQNLTALQAIEINQAAGEYSQLLHEALHVGTSVHQELQQLR